MSAAASPRASFTAAEIRRAIKAVRSTGERVAGVDFPVSGGFRVLVGEPMAAPAPAGPGGANEWDAVLARQ